MASTPSSPEEDGVALTADAKTRKEIITIHKWHRQEVPRCEHKFKCEGLCYDYVSYIERDDRPGHADSEARRQSGIGANGSSRRVSSSKPLSLKDYAERKKKPLDGSGSKMDKPSPSTFNFANGSRLNLPILFKVGSPVHAPPPSDTEPIRPMDPHGENDYLSPISTESNRNLKRPSPAPIDRPLKKQRKEPTPKPSTPRSHPKPPPPPPTVASPAAAKPARIIKPPPSLPKKPPPPEKPPTKQPTPLKLPILSPELPPVVEDALKVDNMVELFGPLVSPTLPSVVEHFLVELEKNSSATKKVEKKDLDQRERPVKVATSKSEKVTEKGLDKEQKTGKAVRETKKKEVREATPEARPKKTATTAQKTTAGKTLKKDKDAKTISEPPAKKTIGQKTVKRDLESKESMQKSRAPPEEFARKTVMKERPTATKTLKKSTASVTFDRPKTKGKQKLIMVWAYAKDGVDLKARLKRKRDTKDDFIPPAKKTKTEMPSPLPKKTSKPPTEAASPLPKKSRLEPASPVPKKKIEPASPLPAKKKAEVSRVDVASPQPKKSWNEASSSTPRTKPVSTTTITNGTPRPKDKESSTVKDITPQKKRPAQAQETPKKSAEVASTPGDSTSRPNEPPPQRKRLNGDDRKPIRNPEADRWKATARSLKHDGEGKNLTEQERQKLNITESRVKLVESVLAWIVSFLLEEQTSNNIAAIMQNWDTTKPLAHTVVNKAHQFQSHPQDDMLLGIAYLLEAAISQHILDLDLEHMDQKIQYYPDFPCRACRKDHVGRCPSHFLVLHKDLKRACEGVRNFLNVDVLMNKFETSWGKRSRTSKPPSIKQASQGNLVCAFSLPVHIGSGVNLLEVVNAGYALMGEYCKKKGIKFENRLIKASKSAASGS